MDSQPVGLLGAGRPRRRGRRARRSCRRSSACSRRNPDHPGAIHLYIHAVEASDRPKRAEPYADRLRGAVPGAGHLVHMPSHIYYRVGRYLDALADNKTAVDGRREIPGGTARRWASIGWATTRTTCIS